MFRIRTAGPLRRIQAAAIGLPDACGITRLDSYPMGSPRSGPEPPGAGTPAPEDAGGDAGPAARPGDAA
jgi:hypothetical protein